MRLTDATFVAIDMDFTLVSYRADALVPLVRGLCLRYLVQEEGYCRELLEVWGLTRHSLGAGVGC